MVWRRAEEHEPVHTNGEGGRFIKYYCYCFIAILLLMDLDILCIAKHQCISLAMCYHAVVHIATISVDPADLNVRIKKSYRNPIPAFDRSKHKHVIENLHCHLCSVDV